jgi:hypothetical protein
MSSTSSQASAASPSDSKDPGCEPLPSVKPMSRAGEFWPVTGQESPSTTMCGPLEGSSAKLSAADSRASHSVPRLEEGTTPSTSGRKCSDSCERTPLDGSSLRMCLGLAMMELTGCAVTFRTRVTPHGRSIWILRRQAGTVDASASSFWPTPTAKANHDAPSMRKWPAYQRYQDAVGRTTPLLWEWMMDFPAGWTALECSAMPSPLGQSNSSAGQS